MPISAKRIIDKGKVDIPIYDETVVMIWDRQHYNLLMETAEADTVGDYHKGSVLAVDISGKTYITVGVFDNALATLAHEVAHACFLICHTKGVSTSYPEDEPFAYLMGYIFNKCMELRP